MIRCILNLPVALLILASSLLYFCPLSVRERQEKQQTDSESKITQRKTKRGSLTRFSCIGLLCSSPSRLIENYIDSLLHHQPQENLY